MKERRQTRKADMDYYGKRACLVGHTPLVKLNPLNKGLKPLILARWRISIQAFGKGSSAISMIDAAERAGF